MWQIEKYQSNHWHFIQRREPSRGTIYERYYEKYYNENECQRYLLFVSRLKFGELPFHLIRARRFKDLFENVLFNYEWLHAKLSSCPLQAVLSDFEDACNFIDDQSLIR